MTPRLILEQEASGVHRARWVVSRPDLIFENGYVAVREGIIRDVGAGGHPPADRIVDHGDAALLPALVNAHTHLELTAIAGKISCQDGFRSWVRQLIAARDGMSPSDLASGVMAGLQAVMDSGCAVIGDISTTGISKDLLAASGIGGIWFQEFLGACASQDVLQEPSHPPFLFSLAGHAVHTTSPALLKTLKSATSQRSLVFSIHLDESEDEREFTFTGRGPWADFLTLRGIDFRDWPLQADSPVSYADRLGILDDKTLAVHLLQAEPKDISILKERKATVCVCPRSNAALHGRLPDIPAMIRQGIVVCLGTDSSASAPSLSLMDEMVFTRRMFPGIDPQCVFTMATINGAKALGLSHRYGSLEPGKSASLVSLPGRFPRQHTLLEHILHDIAFS